MLEPDDVPNLLAQIEELIAPLREALAVLSGRLDRIELMQDLRKSRQRGRARRRRAAPSSKLSSTAREYHRQYRRVMGRDYLGMTAGEFAAAVVNAEREGGERFDFLRD
jgi:hypothetical protein